MQPAIFLTTITHCAACYIAHSNYSLCSLLYCSQQLLIVHPAIFLTTITHCAACYIPHNNYSLCSLLYCSQHFLCLFMFFNQHVGCFYCFRHLIRTIGDTLLDVCRKWLHLIIAFQEGGAASTTLRQVTVQIINQATCNSAYSAHGGVTSNMICAGVSGGGRDACQVTGSW